MNKRELAAMARELAARIEASGQSLEVVLWEFESMVVKMVSRDTREAYQFCQATEGRKPVVSRIGASSG